MNTKYDNAMMYKQHRFSFRSVHTHSSRILICQCVLVLMLCLTLVACQSSGTGIVQTPAESAYTETIPAGTISYLGPEGTYTQEACMTFFDEQSTLIPYKTVPEAVDALIQGDSHYAVIPQENTIGGPVTDYIDVLIQQSSVSVVGEVELTINQNLLVLPGTTLDDIHTVYSHKQGIAQGKNWLKEHLPDAEIIEVSSTAEGARLVAEKKDPSYAAIASSGCSSVYHLDILAENIQNNDRNKTRFYVLSSSEPSRDSFERIAWIATGSARDLPALLSRVEKEKMTLIAIHDRPQKTELGQYHYVIECRGSYANYENITRDSPFTFRYLGSFPVRS